MDGRDPWQDVAVSRRDAWRLLALAAASAALACGRPPVTPEAVSPPLRRPCDPQLTSGTFVVDLVAAERDGDTPYTQVVGEVWDVPQPWHWSNWPVVVADGACRLRRHPTCTAGCGSGLCFPNDRCGPFPVPLDVGTATLTGLETPIELTWRGSSGYSGVTLPAYPPFSPDQALTLAAGGAEVSPFTLAGAGIEPLRFDGDGLLVARGRSFRFTWTAPAAPSRATINAVLILTPSLAVSIIECDLPDNGAGEMPAALVDRLLDDGINGYPHIYLSRRTVDSTDTERGCIEFTVRSLLRKNPAVEGVTSCSDDSECSPPATCLSNLTCG